MSTSQELRYERARRRRELYESRVRGTVSEHLARYESVIADMRREELDGYVRGEFDHAVALIGLARGVIADDVDQAREFSFEAGDLLRGLPAHARQLKRGEVAALRECERTSALRAEMEEARWKLSAEAEKARGAAAEALKSLVAKLDESLKSDIEASGAEAARKVLKDADAEADRIAVDEELRKDTIKALAATMRGLGFVPDPVVWQGKWMRVRFHNLNGEQALFLVGADGGMKYSFSGYRGAACKADRDRVHAKLEDCYGVRFSDVRVIGRNPDEVGKEAKNASRPETLKA